MMRRISTLIAVCLSWSATAQMTQPEDLEQGFVIVVDDVARLATNDRPMFLASNYGGWDPAKPEFKMSPRSDGRWQIVFEKGDRTGTLQFKFTLGSWDFVETDPDGADIDNRTLPKIDRSTLSAGEKPVFELRVPKFRSPSDIAGQRQATQYRDLEVTGDVRRLQVAGGAGGAAGSMRDLLVWLPPAYDAPENRDRRYPVLYLFDGQNIFENASGAPDEWHADEIATELVTAGEIRELIIVGVPHSGEFRAQEYLAFDGGRGDEPHGEAFAEWIDAEVMPRVERAFRVSTEPSDTGVGGASYGAAISLYIGTRRPDRFGRLLLESMPAIGSDYIGSVRTWPERVCLGIDGQALGPGEDVQERNRVHEAWNLALADRIKANSSGDADRFRMLVSPEGKHNEESWAERLPSALRFLYPPQ